MILSSSGDALNPLLMVPDHALCLCHSGECFSRCCRPYLDGAQSAPTALALMRSRYSAYTMNRAVYLRETWHSSTCPVAIDFADNIQWRALNVLWIDRGGMDDVVGVVAFVAYYEIGGQAKQLREISSFRREGTRWYYVAGDIAPATVSRNSPCPCGSGKKFKRCCALSV